MKLNKQTLADIGEFELIKRLEKINKQNQAVVGIGDDTAVIRYTKKEFQLFTTDMLIEGIHFAKGTQTSLIGQKAVNCSISDIAAMGGLPTDAVISIGIPPQRSLMFIKQLYHGINKAAKKFSVNIVGGDTVKSPCLVINVAMTGKVAKKNLVTRFQAKPGDQIFVTGPLGGSLKSGRHMLFTPRLKEAQYLVDNFKPTAMIDISDGLTADLGHILTKSKVGAILFRDKIPASKGCRFKQALYDGEDFELAFTLSKRTAARLLATKNQRFRFYHIGEVTKKGYSYMESNGKKVTLKNEGYNHFKKRST